MGGKLRVIKEHFELLFQQGIVRPSSNQWANPLHMVPKLKDDWRATGHFRKLNAETTLDRSLPDPAHQGYLPPSTWEEHLYA